MARKILITKCTDCKYGILRDLKGRTDIWCRKYNRAMDCYECDNYTKKQTDPPDWVLALKAWEEGGRE